MNFGGHVPPQQPDPGDLGPIKPYPIRGDKCRCCEVLQLAVIHDEPISYRGSTQDTFVCEACDTPDPRFTLSSLNLDKPHA